MLRPGDRFEAEVYRIHDAKNAPPHVRDTFRIVGLNIEIPGQVRTYFATLSWSIEKMGGEPCVGDRVAVEYGPPHPYDRPPKGRFRLVGRDRFTNSVNFNVTVRDVDEFKRSQTMTKTLIGRVERDFHRSASYVRVAVPGHDGVPLCLKATRGVFDRDLFKKGVVVEVARSDPNDARRYHVVKVFNEAVGEVEEDVREMEPYQPETFLSRTKQVRFFLGCRYFNDASSRDRLIRVLASSFGIEFSEANRICRGLGSWIICREEQFARFLINRDAAAIPNGFQDLRVSYVDREPGHSVDVSGRDLER